MTQYLIVPVTPDEGMIEAGYASPSEDGVAGMYRAALAAAPPIPDDVVEDMCRAHDAEDAAQRGEPSPWTWWVGEQIGEPEDWEEFRSCRIASMRAALAVLGAKPLLSEIKVDDK